MPVTSSLGHSLPVEGVTLGIGNGASPEVFTTIANISEITLPLTAAVADVTNVGDLWRSRVSTLLDMGKIMCKIFYVPKEGTHDNVSGGLLYVMLNRTLTDFKLTYPDAGVTVDTFAAYVTSFSITGKVAGVFEASVEFSSSGAPVIG